jgi:hypothetical protein
MNRIMGFDGLYRLVTDTTGATLFPAARNPARIDRIRRERNTHRSAASRKDAILGGLMFSAFLIASFAIYIALFCPSVLGEFTASLAMLVR